MKINDNRERKMQSFNSIHTIGKVFEYAGEIYMTIKYVEDDDEDCFNAICLNDGELVFLIDEQVQILDNVTLEIH